MSSPVLLRLINASWNATKEATRITKEILRRGDLGVVEKGVNDPQTEADRASQKFIISSLKYQFPGLNVVGEEDLKDESIEIDVGAQTDVTLGVDCPELFKTLDVQDFTVWVDPIDGTSEFTQGLLDHVTILIGISAHKKAIAGVIGQPFYNYQNKDAVEGRIIWGGVGGLGLHGIEAKATIDRRAIVTSRGHHNKVNAEAVEACKPTETLCAGGAGHKVLMVVEGIASAYVFASQGTKRWDTCAPEAVLRAAGGLLTDSFGELISYDSSVLPYNNTRGVIASCTPALHSDFLACIPDSVKDALLAKEASLK